MPTLDLDAVADKYAVYNGASDAPLYNPLSNLPDLLWHSDLSYIGRIANLSGTIDLNPNSAGWSSPGGGFYPRELVLGAHGQSFTPIILGSITIGGVAIPAQGTFLANPATLTGALQYNIYCDATNIIMQCDLAHGEVGTLTTQSCFASIDIMNVGTDGSGNLVEPTYNPGFDATDTYIRSGRFDTSSTQYLVKNNVGQIGFFAASSLQATIGQPKYKAATYRTLCLIYKFASYVNHELGETGDTGGGFSPTVITASYK